jgi:hypothetical protein
MVSIYVCTNEGAATVSALMTASRRAVFVLALVMYAVKLVQNWSQSYNF